MAVVRVIQANVLGKSEVAIDEHAEQRMAERGVTDAQVIATLQKPDRTGLRADPGRMRVRRHYGSHAAIDVVYEEKPTQILVISAIRVRRN
jgi:hypothetical protein